MNNNTNNIFNVRCVLNTRTGVKYFAMPDLISYLNRSQEGESEIVQAFIREFIVTLATASDVVENSV